MTKVLDRGSEWGANRLYNDWGECGPEADRDGTYKKLGNLVVGEWDRLVIEAGGQASWIPYTSEVVGPIDEEEIDYAALREEAYAAVRGLWTDGEIDPVKLEEIK